MNPEDLAALNEEIAGMARAGLPLDQGLSALARDMMGGRLQRVTEALAEDLREGKTLPEALDRQAGEVPPYYAGLVSAGVRTGRIAEVLTVLTLYARSMAALRRLVLDALFYPCVILGFSSMIAVAVFVFLIPQFDEIFRSFNMKLPALTEAVLIVSRHRMFSLVLPILAVVIAVLAVRFAMRTTVGGRQLWARLVYAVPVAGTLIRAARLAAFTELLAILVDHDTPLPESFRLAGQACSDPVMAGACENIHAQLSNGQPLGMVLRGQGLVPEWVAWMAGLGEQRGGLAKNLHQIAEMYRRQVEMRTGLLRSVLPPILIIVTAGFFVGFFVVALMLPMFKLLEGLSK